jgi:hypothetical protein
VRNVVEGSILKREWLTELQSENMKYIGRFEDLSVCGRTVPHTAGAACIRIGGELL